MIESLQNDKIKRLLRWLNKNSERRRSGCFPVEGRQENERAMQYGFEPLEFFICQELYEESLPQQSVHLVSTKVYNKIAYRGTTEGIIGIYKEKKIVPEELNLPENASVILLESVEKPGNLGAVLRSCEAFGISALIVTDAKADFFNPNVIRSSVGCLFGMNIVQTSNEKAFAYLQENNFQIITTYMQATPKPIQKADLTHKTVVCFGTEHSGLSDFWIGKGENFLIPMSGSIDSLNLSNSVAIACYEILRQKNNQAT